MKCIIIDDDPISRSLLSGFISQTEGLELVEQFGSPIAALDSKSLQEADLIFLDVEMPDMSGLDLLDQCKIPGKVVLTTVNKDYALAGFECDAVDFMLKPFKYDRFIKAVQKVEKAIGAGVHEEPVSFKSGKVVNRVTLGDIQWIEGAGEYLNVVTKSGHFLVYSNMKNMMEQLDDRFLQVHRSFIVNRESVKAFTKNKVVINGKDIPVSKTYYSALQKVMVSKVS